MPQDDREPWTQYADRFDVARYSEDEPVRLWLIEGSSVDNELIVPETIWHRLRLIAAAYSLHLLPLLDGSTDPVLLGGEQARTLAAEVDFVTVASDDGGLIAVAELVIRIASRAMGGGDAALGIEFP
jgi:hypothetical protein